MFTELLSTVRRPKRLPFAGPTELPDVTRHWHPVMKAGKLKKKPERVVIMGRPIVLYRDASGQPCALADQCPHRRSSLSLGVVRPDGRLACGYHGWHFDQDGNGQCPTQPKLKCKTRAYRVVEKLGFLWVADKDTSLEDLPEFVKQADTLTGAWAGFQPVGTVTMPVHAPLQMAVDNFGEVEHIPYVHKMLGWSAEDVPEVKIEIQNLSDRTEAFVAAPQRRAAFGPMMLIDKLLINRSHKAILEYGFQFSPVHTTFQPGWGDPVTRERKRFSMRATSVLVPVSENFCWLHNFAFMTVHEAKFRWLTPLLKKAIYWRLVTELRNDVDFIEMIADAPHQLRGMKLTKQDKQVAHNRKLLQQIYFGEQLTDVPNSPDMGTEATGPELIQATAN